MLAVENNARQSPKLALKGGVTCHFTAGEQDVLRLEIAVNESLVVSVGEGFERAEDDRLRLRQRKAAPFLSIKSHALPPSQNSMMK